MLAFLGVELELLNRMLLLTLDGVMLFQLTLQVGNVFCRNPAIFQIGLFQLVCGLANALFSCPTCIFFLRQALLERACLLSRHAVFLVGVLQLSIRKIKFFTPKRKFFSSFNCGNAVGLPLFSQLSNLLLQSGALFLQSCSGLSELSLALFKLFDRRDAGGLLLRHALFEGADLFGCIAVFLVRVFQAFLVRFKLRLQANQILFCFMGGCAVALPLRLKLLNLLLESCAFFLQLSLGLR